MILYSESKGGTGQYRVSTSTEKQFRVLKTLMNRKDAESLVNCCNAGREGELIFHLVRYQYGCRKLVERLWISFMELQACKTGKSLDEALVMTTSEDGQSLPWNLGNENVLGLAVCSL